MHPVYRQLCSDHRHIQRLLHCMRTIINPLGAEGVSPERLELLLDIVEYIKTYPEYWHHPIEDQVFSLLLLKRVPESELLREIICDHGRMEKQTAELEHFLRSIAQGCVVPIKNLKTLAELYIHNQADHIEKENKWVYPLMEQHLQDEDWQWIAEKLPAIEDPLFGEKRRKDYENLYSNIVAGEQDLLQLSRKAAL
ncbi:MAG: hemerythrin domain-containing protein [Cellvibrionaceae bacterium]|nr:hemerythrin domain-containing protein [Cellvibrionaceae bacterium]